MDNLKLTVVDANFIKACGVSVDPGDVTPGVVSEREHGTLKLNRSDAKFMNACGVTVEDQVTADWGDVDLMAIENSVAELIEYLRGEAVGQNLYHARTREKLWNKAVRQAYLIAAQLELQRKPFNVFGRGHEPRITLGREDAAILRSVASLPSNPLHRVYIAGFGPKHYYAKRLVDTAERVLAEFKKELN